MNASNSKRVFITGGAGFLGINLARHLLAKGFEVTSYDLLPFNYPERDRITEITGDIRNAKELAAAMRGADYVVHAAAALPLYSPEDIYSTDVIGTRNVLETASDSTVQRVVHISSTAVYGIPDHHPLLEDDRLDGVGPYGEAKILAEYECLKYRSKGLCVPIIRPKSFVGPERLGVFALLYDWALTGHGFPMIGNGHNRYQLLDVEDLCHAIYLALTADEKKANETFNVGASQFATMREDYQSVLDAAGFHKKIRGIPAGPMIWTLRILDRLSVSPLYKWVYETASKDSFVSTDKIQKALGWKPQFSNQDALVKNYRWYVKHREEFAGQSGVTHRVPWKQGAIGAFKRFF